MPREPAPRTQCLDHDLVSDLEVTPEPLEEFLERTSRLLTDQPVSTLLCGVYLSGVKLVHPILSALPPVIHLSQAEVLTQSIAGLDTCSAHSRK